MAVARQPFASVRGHRAHRRDGVAWANADRLDVHAPIIAAGAARIQELTGHRLPRNAAGLGLARTARVAGVRPAAGRPYPGRPGHRTRLILWRAPVAARSVPQ